jgi:hypothetical protein
MPSTWEIMMKQLIIRIGEAADRDLNRTWYKSAWFWSGISLGFGATALYQLVF